MSSTAYSRRRIDKVTSDNLSVGFDLLSNLTYMSVLAVGNLPREQILELCSGLRLKTSIFFGYIYILAKRLGFEYTQAFQMVSEKAKASNIKSLLLRFAASISSGESEAEFVVQETRTEGERYKNEYERSVENLRKWTDAYAAVLISVTLIMVVSLVSTMIGSLGQGLIVAMGFVLLFITSIGVFVIYKVAPVEQVTFDGATTTSKQRRRARILLVALAPAGIALAFLIAPQMDLKGGVSFSLLVIGASLLPAGWYAWKDDAAIRKLDTELAVFLRSIGNVAGATGVTLSEAMRRIDTKSMGSLQPHINRLKVRLGARLPSYECWERFREETGSELVNRASRMMVGGAERGGEPDQVGEICSTYALNVTQLRAKRALTASTFSFLTVPMHATMIFILIFVLEVVASFSARLGEASKGLATSSSRSFEVPDSLPLPPGVALPAGGDLSAGLQIFGVQDMSLATYMIMFVVIVLTVANALAPKAAAGGSNLKIVSFIGVMCIISGGILGVVPIVTGKLFAI